MIKLSYKHAVWVLILINHILMLMGVYYIVIESSYQWLIVMFIGILLSILGGDIGTHRYLAHRSFKTGPIRDSILKILSVKNCLGSPMTWAIIHRYHHINSDTSGDPHFPDGIKSWLTLWNPSSPWWDIKISPRPKDCIDLLKDPLVGIIHKYYFYIIFLMFISLYLIDWKLLVFLISIPSVITFHGNNFLVNTICHKWGYRNFDINDNSTNNTLVNYLTVGAGLHNNHHANPDRYSNKVNSNEIDPSGWFIEKFLMT